MPVTYIPALGNLRAPSGAVLQTATAVQLAHGLRARRFSGAAFAVLSEASIEFLLSQAAALQAGEKPEAKRRRLESETASLKASMQRKQEAAAAQAANAAKKRDLKIIIAAVEAQIAFYLLVLNFVEAARLILVLAELVAQLNEL